MTKKSPMHECGQRSKSWPEFRDRLSKVVGELAEDEYLIISVKHSKHFVQFAGQGSHGLRAETTSNHFLEKGERLNSKQVAALRAMGWRPPTGKPKQATPEKDPDGSPNFFIEFQSPVIGERVAQMAVETLAGILHVPYPGLLEYQAFG
jgi:hypothetical protein